MIKEIVNGRNVPRLQKVTWQEVREKVTKVNSQLAKIIDELSPGKDLPLWIAAYPFGTVVDDGKFNWPTPDGELARLDDIRLQKDLKADFQYTENETPAGVVLHSSLELLIEAEDHITPQDIFEPGHIFALWGRLDSKPVYHPGLLQTLVAGARSIFMLPNISDLASHKRLKNDFNVRQAPPKNLLDQWSIFSTIANHPAAKSDWHAELLFFPGIWLEKTKHDDAFQKLYVFLLETAWGHSAFWRNKVFYDFVFSCAERNRNLKPNPYLADTVKHLVALAIGAVPGFGVATDNLFAPIDVLQRVFVESYGLKKYAPTIMHPAYFNLDKLSKPAYYSLQNPTTLEFSPRSRQFSNTLHDLGEIKHIADVFISEILRGRLKVEQSIVGMMAKIISFDFFHSKPDRHGDIKLTKEMPLGDNLLTYSSLSSGSKDFAETGTFVRGCIRISHKAKILSDNK